jgi:hypothetical protein
MLYFLGTALKDEFSVLNVLTYHTVRAGGAAATAFFLCLLLGPLVIRGLRRIKFGQFIRQEHVADLHALHKGKAGTPTMGGAMILLASVIALLLWGNLSNRLLLVAMLVFVALGAVGFLDDFISLRKKRNHGISARTKFAGQILIGLFLGFYLLSNPIVVGADYLAPRDILDWDALASTLRATGTDAAPPLADRFARQLSPEVRAELRRLQGPLEEPLLTDVLRELNSVLGRADVYSAAVVAPATLNGEGQRLVAQGVENLQVRERVRLNRILLEAAFPAWWRRARATCTRKLRFPG